jgi:phospholipid/cholesterol/gamma-HCH transport system permease protein
MARGATKKGADAGNAWRLSADQPGGDITLHLAGPWTLQGPLPPAREVESQLPAAGTAARLLFETGELAAWDSSLLTFLIAIEKLAKARGMTIDRAGLPTGVGRLLDLASAVPERAGARRSGAVAPWLQRVGTATISAGKATSEMIGFVGEAVMAFGKLFVGRARFRRSDLMLIIQDCGASALGIVTLISILVGLILAFVGAIQLEAFGAQIYVADLVGIATVREMGAMMTAIVMAGRTGAAFAAQLGTMQVNEEIDALATLGLSPMEFLVLPRMLALILMMPLLCIYADLMGILGGAVVGIGMLHLSPTLYITETQHAIGLVDIGVGVFKAGVFGVLIALAGCLRGMQCGRSASAVGLAATSAVVTGIVFIIATDGLFAVITNVLKI